MKTATHVVGLGAAIVYLAFLIVGCSRERSPRTRTFAAPTQTVDQSELGVSITEQAALQTTTHALHASIESTAFSQNGKHLALTRYRSTAHANRKSPSFFPTWNRTSYLETVCSDRLSYEKGTISAQSKEAFQVLPAPSELVESIPNADEFILVRWDNYAPAKVIVATSDNQIVQPLDFRPTFAASPYTTFRLRSVAAAPDRPFLAVGVGGDHDGNPDTPFRGELILWNIQTGEEQQRFSSSEMAFYGVAFSPDGKMIAGVGHTPPGRSRPTDPCRGQLHCWDAMTRELLFVTKFAEPGWSMAFSPDSSSIAVGHNGIIRLFTSDNGTEYASHRLVATRYLAWCHVNALAFSRDSQFVAAGVGHVASEGRWGELLLVDVVGKKAAVAGFHNFSHPVTCVDFSPSGDQIAAGTHGGAFRLFSVKRLTMPDTAQNSANPEAN